jgi:hypothetical protein
LGPQAPPITGTLRLTVTVDLPAALEALEAATLHRTRLLVEHEAATIAALRDADLLDEPLPPLPPLLLIADATEVYQRARIAALLT